MASRKPPPMRLLTDEERVLTLVQDHWGELLQISPWVMGRNFNLRMWGTGPMDFAEFAHRMAWEVKWSYTRPLDESILEAETIGQCVNWAIEQFTMDRLLSPRTRQPMEVPKRLWRN